MSHRRDDSLAADADLRRHVRPSGWRNPAPKGTYGLVVIGGGTAGLVCAMGAAGLGARVALVERHLLGGDCLNTGCVPSKALIRSARAVADVRRAADLGVEVSPPRVDFAAVMARLRARRAAIAPHDSAARLQAAGVDVFFGQARFSSPRVIAVDDRRLRFSRAVIATGGRPSVPPIPGLDTVPYLTNETIFDLDTLPRRLLVLGAGSIGCELAQAFARLGADVTLVDQAPQVLPREDATAAALVQQALERDGVRMALGIQVDRADSATGDIRLHLGGREHAGPGVVSGDALLVAVGRSPNVADLGLDAAGIRADRRGIVVDDRLRSSNSRVYASGDVCSEYKFTHAADALSRIVLQNALFFGRRRASALVVPWVTYTDPEVAHVGATHADAAAGRVSTITIALDEVDRAIVDDRTDGFVRVYHHRGRLRGCTIVAAHAGEMIGEAAYALTHGGTLAQFAGTIHPYPTQAEALRKAGDAYRRQALTPLLRRWLRRYFRWTR